jgi:hypothetical protein
MMLGWVSTSLRWSGVLLLTVFVELELMPATEHGAEERGRCSIAQCPHGGGELVTPDVQRNLLGIVEDLAAAFATISSVHEQGIRCHKWSVAPTSAVLPAVLCYIPVQRACVPAANPAAASPASPFPSLKLTKYYLEASENSHYPLQTWTHRLPSVPGT